MEKIKYRKLKKYKYQLIKTYCIQTSIYPDEEINLPFLTLTVDGLLILKKGYAWDGDTFAIDFECSREASLVHDAICQMVNEGSVSEIHMGYANDLYMCMCINGGMWEPWSKVRRRGLKRYWGR
jgi:hypothetical protein